jgi:hypothetical protein
MLQQMNSTNNTIHRVFHRYEECSKEDLNMANKQNIVTKRLTIELHVKIYISVIVTLSKTKHHLTLLPCSQHNTPFGC